ncbi:MAG: transporter substrate-binding domain-containing protein [Chloroflexota bacterium]
MGKNNTAKLRRVLAKLYKDQSSIERIAHDAGIDLSRINLNSKPIVNWHSVLTEAELTNRVYELIEVVEQEYGENSDFQNALALYSNNSPFPSSNVFKQTSMAKSGLQFGELIIAIFAIIVLPLSLFIVLQVISVSTLESIVIAFILAVISSFIVAVWSFSSNTEIVISWLVGIVGILAFMQFILPALTEMSLDIQIVDGQEEIITDEDYEIIIRGENGYSDKGKTDYGIRNFEGVPKGDFTIEVVEAFDQVLEEYRNPVWGQAIVKVRIPATPTPGLQSSPTPSNSSASTNDDSGLAIDQTALSTTIQPPPATPFVASTPNLDQKILEDAGVLVDGKIRVGVRFDAPPYGSYNDGADYNCDPSSFDKKFDPKGYDIQIARKLAERWLNDNTAVQFICVPLADRTDIVREGRHKIYLGIFSFSKTTERCNKVLCSESYMLDGQGVFTYENSEINELCDVRGKTIIVSRGTTAALRFQEVAEQFCGTPPPIVVPFGSDENRDTLIGHVASQRYPTYATNVEIVNALAQNEPNLRFVPGKFGPAEEFVIAVNPNRESVLHLINDALIDWKENGVLLDLMDEADFKCMDSDALKKNLCGMVPISDSISYTVKAGDTLGGIAIELWGKYELWGCIADKNNISRELAIITNEQILNIPMITEC